MSFERKLGVVLSRPVAYLFFLIYLAQSCVLIYFVYEYYDNRQTIHFQQKRITELEEKLQILKVIEDFQVGLTTEQIGTLAAVIDSESKRYLYDPRLLLAVILTESSMKNGQVSYQGAHGLMQIRPATAADVAGRTGLGWRGNDSLFDPAYNVRLGSRYLFELILKFGDVRKALVAYNWGETNLRTRLKAGEQIPSEYLRKVMARYQELCAKYDFEDPTI
ncbi:MAG: lytic transglycosylase domain-containing protein [candidate division Zixibacteria bacterium]|nr:lytic transglycosylase domain-containing protein [candidate division Zixibacteria bacterium]